jgi:hypothetical protein
MLGAHERGRDATGVCHGSSQSTPDRVEQNATSLVNDVRWYVGRIKRASELRECSGVGHSSYYLVAYPGAARWFSEHAST